MPTTPAVSVVVPLFNEEENVRPLVEAVRNALGTSWNWELVLVDDGSTDGTPRLAQQVAAGEPRVRLVRLARNFGQTAAMQAGFDHSRGEVVVSMDGDLQNDARDIPALLAKLDQGYDLVVGYRQHRQDALLRRKVPSWVANRLIARITGIAVRDNGCSLKAYRRGVLRRLRLYSEMHRFIPALAAASAGARIAEIPVRHHARQFGSSKYGLSRVFGVFSDLLVIKTIHSFRDRPLLLFATGAAGSAALGVAFAAVALLAAVDIRPDMADAVVVPGAAMLCFGLAFFLIMLGLIGEVVLRQQRREGGGPLSLISEVLP